MIFISAPYSHVDKAVTEARLKQVANYCANLIRSGKTAVSPLLYGHTILQYVNIGSDYVSWRKFCVEVLSNCIEMHVLKIEGWQESTGVADEIATANSTYIPVVYIEPGVTFNEQV